MFTKQGPREEGEGLNSTSTEKALLGELVDKTIDAPLNQDGSIMVENSTHDRASETRKTIITLQDVRTSVTTSGTRDRVGGTCYSPADFFPVAAGQCSGAGACAVFAVRHIPDHPASRSSPLTFISIPVP
jgi:hypothetical protein